VAQLFVVRHADAGSRHAHDGSDDERELTTRGWKQAEGLCDQLADAGITRLLASPSLRCVQTLEPLATKLGLVVEPDQRLAEGNGAGGALELADELRAEPAVLCSHGDVIPDLLDALLRRGTRLEDDLRWQKASTWVFTWHGDELATGAYRPPPR
jgi:phosphohistidine phosphatase SixA